MSAPRFKVQHNSREIGPFSLAELRHEADSGGVCMMDWCWNDGAFDGVLTVYQVLCEERREGSVSAFLSEQKPSGVAVEAPLRGPVAGQRERRSLEAERNEFESYRRRALQSVHDDRMSLAQARRLLAKEQSAFFKQRAKAEAETTQEREDLETLRVALADERHKLAEHQRRHARSVTTFDKARKTAVARVLEERRRAREELVRIAEEELRLKAQREDNELARNRMVAELEELRERLKLEQRRHTEAAKRLADERAAFEQQSAALREELSRERARLAEERRRLAAIERALHEEREAFDETRRLQLAELLSQRRELDAERRILEQTRHAQAGAQHHRHATAAGRELPKDERHFGRILGLRGKVSFDEIKRSYRFAALRCHPDKVQDLDPEFAALANSKLRELNEAFEFFKLRYAAKGD